MLVRILELSSKVGMAFAVSDFAIADEVLNSAASVSQPPPIVARQIDGFFLVSTQSV